MISSPTASNVGHSGYLLKDGLAPPGGRPPQLRRYYHIRGTVMRCYKTQHDELDCGQVDLAGAKVRETKSGCTFALESGSLGRPLRLTADSQAEKQRWIDTIIKVGKASLVTQPTTVEREERKTATQIKFRAALQRVLGMRAFSPKNKDTVSLGDFEELKLFAKGSWGSVSKVREKDTGQIFAMKMLRKEEVIEGGMMAHTMAEKNVLCKLDHPFIVKFHYAFQTANCLYLILDLLPGGELYYHLQLEGKFSERRAKLYTASIVSAFEHLHDNDIVYRDLKPENIVLDATGHACLTDFGLARTTAPKLHRSNTQCGTPEYWAPEMVSDAGHDVGVDWWALGIMLFEMLTGLPPFYSEDQNHMIRLILEKPLEFPDEVSPEACSLIRQLLDRDPNERLKDAQEVKIHEFFADIDWEKLNKREIAPEWTPDLSSNPDRYINASAEELGL